MNLFCVNAHVRNGAYVGLICDSSVPYMLVEQLQDQHPDKWFFEILPYCPVWAGEAWAVWEKWHHFRGPAKLLFVPFEKAEMFQPVLVPGRLQMKAFVDVYHPFELAPWFWGEHINAVQVGLAMARIGTKNPNYNRDWGHAERIAHMMVYPQMEPVQIVKYKALPHGWMLRDGAHRYAAAYLRGDKEIPCLMEKESVEDLVAMGLVKI